jgi:DNA-binding transcriptional regulator WhiA
VDLQNCTAAYIVGVALGDGNLSNPNGRTPRLRITCDAKYPNIADEIIGSLKELFPKNKVSIINHKEATYFNISIYSKKLEYLLP